jgi:hypothetical protein
MPTKDSAVSRALRVLFYTVLPTLVAVLSDPDAVRAVQDYIPFLLPAIVAGAPILSLVYNILRRDVVNYR